MIHVWIRHVSHVRYSLHHATSFGEGKNWGENVVSAIRHHNMAAIAEISSLQEWEEEWQVLEQDTQKFKVLRFLCHCYSIYYRFLII